METNRLDDLEVYKLLLADVERYQALAARCHSPAAATAIRATSVQIRTLASGLYRGSIRNALMVEEKAASV